MNSANGHFTLLNYSITFTEWFWSKCVSQIHSFIILKWYRISKCERISNKFDKDENHILIKMLKKKRTPHKRQMIWKKGDFLVKICMAVNLFASWKKSVARQKINWRLTQNCLHFATKKRSPKAVCKLFDDRLSSETLFLHMSSDEGNHPKQVYAWISFKILFIIENNTGFDVECFQSVRIKLWVLQTSIYRPRNYVRAEWKMVIFMLSISLKTIWNGSRTYFFQVTTNFQLIEPNWLKCVWPNYA